MLVRDKIVPSAAENKWVWGSCISACLCQVTLLLVGSLCPQSNSRSKSNCLGNVNNPLTTPPHPCPYLTGHQKTVNSVQTAVTITLKVTAGVNNALKFTQSEDSFREMLPLCRSSATVNRFLCLSVCLFVCAPVCVTMVHLEHVSKVKQQRWAKLAHKETLKEAN